MVRKSVSIVTGIVLDDELVLELEELARACDMQAEWVLALVEEGIIEPLSGERSRARRFPGASLARARMAARLQRDFELNLAGIALVLDLMEEIKTLRVRLGLTDK